MAETRRLASMGFTDEKFPAGTHMCLIYDNEDERRRIIGKYLAAGRKDHEKVSYFVDTMDSDDVVAWLRAMGVDVPRDGRSPEFLIASAAKTYCPGGKFVPSEMMGGLGALYQGALDENYSGVRVSGEMSWALRGIPGSDRLIEYESKVNTVFETSPIVAICQYDSKRFSGAMILDVLRVHPMLIVEGRVARNPYYMTPQDFQKSRS